MGVHTIITHTWNIDALEYADVGNLTKVVKRAKWLCVSDDNAGHSVNSDGSVPLDLPHHDVFTDYDALTETEVLGWLGASLIAATEAANVLAIQKLIDAEVTNTGTGVPW